jgi:predicted phage terminase large subunit-like protein
MARATRAIDPEEALNSIPPLTEWLEKNDPEMNWRWPHTQRWIQVLEQVTWGTADRVIILSPPRHGKSQLITIDYPSYLTSIDPTHRTIVGCYGADLAEKFSRKSRALTETNVALSKSSTKVSDWETTWGGGVRSVGVGGGATGMGANLIIIDDPIKSRAEAESPAYREAVWDWYTNDMYTRMEPGAKMIIVMTPWHRYDLVHRILDGPTASKWKVVKLPALAEENDPLGRAVGEALCPERYTRESLLDIQAEIGAYAFEALFQLRPTLREGGMFKWAWFTIIPEIPQANVVKRVRYWDTAGTESGGDYTVGTLMSKVHLTGAQHYYVVEDRVKGQWSVAHRDQQIVAAAERDGAKYGQRAVQIWLEKEAGVGGAERTQAIVSQLEGFNVHTEPASGSKEYRAEPLAGQAEVGNVKIVKATWNTDWLESMAAFGPGCLHDDDTDSASGAFNKLAVANRAFNVGSYR